MRITKCVVAVIAATVLAAYSHAATITATFESVGGGGVLVTPSLNGTSIGTGLAGQYFWKQQSGSPVLGNGGNFLTFCIELTQDIDFNQPPYQYSIVDLATAPQPGTYIGANGMGTARADEIRELFGQDLSKVVDTSTAATFQFAVWRILYGSALTLDSANAGRLATADSWIAGLNANGAKASLIALSSPTAQDQVTIATPLPSAAWGGMLLIGFVGFARFCRKARAA